MDKQTYKQQVWAVCDEMRQKLIETGDAQRLPDDAFLPILARIAVAEMAEAVKQYAIQCAAIPALPGFTVMDYLKEQGLIPDNAPSGVQIGVLQPDEPGYGGYNPDNPPPYDEDMPIVCPSCLMANVTIGTNGNCLCYECNEQFKIEQ